MGVSFSDSAAAPSSQCNGTSRPGPASSKFEPCLSTNKEDCLEPCNNETKERYNYDPATPDLAHVSPNIISLETALAQVDGSEIPFESLLFSFEITPREEWYQTFIRQDMCEEILYYPEP